MKRITGLSAAALVTALAATTLAPTAAFAAPVPPAQLAGSWIAGELTDGLAVGSFGADVGLSIDAGLAYDATDNTVGADLVGDAIADQLVTSMDVPYGYVSSDEYGFEPPYDFVQVGYYANATAKAAAFAQRIGRDAATAYADVDLIDQLETLTDDTSGVVADDSSYGNYANTIGQAFAAEALAVAGSDEADQALDALLAQQCPAGYFLFELGSSDCSSVPSADTTSLAVLSLHESGNESARVAGAISLATQWLESTQRPDGSFEGDSTAPGSNSNSTGLAGWALGESARTTSAAKAAAWVRSMQVADAGACASQAPTGAIAYNPADLAAGRTDGVTGNTTIRDKWRRATFQSSPVLQWAPAATGALGISTPAAAVEKSTVTATVRGLAAGEQGCVSLGTDARRVVGTGSDLTVSFALPAGAAARVFTVATLAGSTTSTTNATLTPVPAPTEPGAPVVGDLKASKVEKVKKNGTFTLTVTCEGTEDCTGKIKVRSAGKVELGNGKKRVLVLAKDSYTVKAGKKANVKLTLTKPAAKVLGSSRVRVVAEQTARGAEPETTKFWLRRK